ncbi:hypothetical protein C8F04DRAFT_704869 [Mycena alexandri]|uniref:Mug135-like C-terminal domain-containing protein n=1 Tax=Mycena alexandri TaxID=1745969 RepID=A0AAD6RVV5_9AGAR|nr:hypothetical protein C8F04DRAFT_704869 [Mycena alexandri]
MPIAIPNLPQSLQGVVPPLNLNDPPTRAELGLVTNLVNHAGIQRHTNLITDDDLGKVFSLQQEVYTAYAAAVATAVAAAVGPAVTAAVGPAVTAAVGPAVTAALGPVLQRLDMMDIKLNKALAFAAVAHNRYQGDGNLLHRPFEIVPFTNGSMPPATLPALVNITIIRNLNDADARAYYRGYGGPQGHLTIAVKKEFVRVAIGCMVDL